jgi:drug/metabolite transporter (DMT)-like permease
MSIVDNAIGRSPVTQARVGLFFGCLGILAFSFSFPATKLALEGLDPWVVAFGRAAVAGLLAAA